MRQVSEESESDSEEESRPNVPRKAPSQAKKQRPNNDAVVEPRRPATTNDERSNNRAQNVPVVRDSSDSESSDFEAIAHRRPIKGEFGEANICRDPQIPEKELFFHYGVKSITELRKLRQMVVPHLINDLDDFHKFRSTLSY
uniref:Uncharacterized protein n=1 Tax=Panagrolaimus superbus TaxID=310955 RepID=A0A914YQU8_9BILA